jgi:hypothetical protein
LYKLFYAKPTYTKGLCLYKEKKEKKKNWEKKAIKAANVLILTLINKIKFHLTKVHFNNSYFIFNKIKEILQLGGDVKFIRFLKEFYLIS